MPFKRSIATVAVLALAGGAAAATTAAASPAVPNTLPPVLRAARPAERTAIRHVEALERAASDYRPPAGAVYSPAEMNAYAVLLA